MRSSIFKSFRFEVVLYSLLSLSYTVLTEAGLFIGFFTLKNLFWNVLGSREGGAAGLEGNEAALKNPSAINSLEGLAGQSGREQHPAPLLGGKGLFFVFVLAVMIGIALFIVYFLLLTKKFILYIDQLSSGIQEISYGNFDARVEINNEDEFGWIAQQINKMARDLKELMEAERKNEKARNDLVTNVAHDLRTPLTSIIGYLDLAIRRPDLEDSVKEKYISIAYDKSKRLEGLIEDLFSYTKYSSGEVSLNLGKIDMVKFMEQMIDEFYPSFQEEGLEYSFQVNSRHIRMEGDGDLLARAFANLIGNAIKYGKDGKTIRIGLEKKEEDVSVYIVNYGKVIPEKELLNIFDRFYRVEASRSSETGGTGLGLAIAKKIILMHGGSISVKSDFDGTVFHVALPLLKESEEMDKDEAKK